MKQVIITKAKYLGGLPGDKGGYSGRLMVNDDGLSVGQLKAPGKGGPVKWEEVEGVSFDSETAAKSRLGKAVLFGVFALIAKNSQNMAVITVNLKSGDSTFYEIKDMNGAAVRAKIQPFMTARSIPCLDDMPAAPTAEATSAADEIAKLAALRDSGAISEEEFSAHKAKLLDS